MSHGKDHHGKDKDKDPSKAPTALVFLAEGAEEMETVIICDILRRAGVSARAFRSTRCVLRHLSIFIVMAILLLLPFIL
jgi:hypothetical protein